MANEPIPMSAVRSELDTNWATTDIAEPGFIEENLMSDTQVFNLNRQNYIIIRAGIPAIEETPVGNWTYGNRLYRVELELMTKTDRQALWNLQAEVRRTLHARMHSFTSFQRVRFIDMQEDFDENVRVWSAKIQIELQNSGVLLETT